MAAKKSKKPTEAMKALLRRSGSNDPAIAEAAQRELAVALTLPLRQGVMKGDIIGGLFQTVDLEPGAAPEFPLDFLSPGTEKDFVAYTIPSHGRIPEKHIESDYVMVNTFDVGSSIDWHLKYARDARWDIVGRAMRVLEASFVRKKNVDGWHALIAAGAGRNLLVTDGNATAGLFTKRLVAEMEITMKRQNGGNSTSVNPGELTDLYLSLEGHADVLSWDLTQIPEAVRNTIYLNWANNGIARIGRVDLHDLYELGVDQEFQAYFEDSLSGSLSGKEELVVGLDRNSTDSFVMPVRAEIEIFEDPQFHRQRRAGMYGFGEYGFGVLDSRRVLLGGF